MSDETLNKIAGIAYSYKETVYHTYASAEHCIVNNIEGIFVECGIGAGAQIAAMQLAVERSYERREIFAFDSFAGIPLCGLNDDQQPGIGYPTHDYKLPERLRLVSSGVTVHSVDNVKGNLLKLGLQSWNITFIEGWFQDTLPIFPNTKIAILRLDGDLYESTMVCMKYLYPMVVKGGIVIIDDYGLPGCRAAVHEFIDESVTLFKLEPEANGVRWFIKN